MLLAFRSSGRLCRIKVGSTIKAFKATEFRSELELNCFIQKVSFSIKAFPALPDGTLPGCIENISTEMVNIIVNTIDSITKTLVTDIARCFVLDFSGKRLVIDLIG